MLLGMYWGHLQNRRKRSYYPRFAQIFKILAILGARKKFGDAAIVHPLFSNSRPYTCVLAAVFQEKNIIIEPLTDFIGIIEIPRNNERIMKLDRLFESLRRGIDNLKFFYTSLIRTQDKDRFFYIIETITFHHLSMTSR